MPACSYFSVIFCCCLCDCRVPKTGYDKDDRVKYADGDDSDKEPEVVYSKACVGGEKVANSSSQQKKVPDTRKTEGKLNEAFESEEETASQGQGWKTIQRAMLSRVRQP